MKKLLIFCLLIFLARNSNGREQRDSSSSINTLEWIFHIMERYPNPQVYSRMIKDKKPWLKSSICAFEQSWHMKLLNEVLYNISENIEREAGEKILSENEILYFFYVGYGTIKVVPIGQYSWRGQYGLIQWTYSLNYEGEYEIEDVGLRDSYLINTDKIGTRIYYDFKSLTCIADGYY